MHNTPIRYARVFPRASARSRRRCWTRYLCSLAAWGLFFGAAGPGRPEFIYFSTSAEIRRVNLDGIGMTTLVRGLEHPFGLALDFAGGMIWADFNGGDIQWANVDGTGQTTLIQGLGAPFSPVLDLAGGQMYWTKIGNSPNLNLDGPGEGSILRANLDGTGLTTLVGNLNFPHPVAVDIAGGKMYWSDGNHPSVPYQGESISRANLDGSGQELIVPGGGGPGIAIALDVAAGKMYWTDNSTGPGSSTGHIHRANLDGSDQEVLLTTVGAPFGLALDVTRGQMYWADANRGSIWRANFDGTGAEIVLTGRFDPQGLALDLRTFLITVTPSPVAGTPFDLTVTALDQSGNIDTNYQGTVTFTSSDPYPGVLPADYTFTASDQGTHTFSGGVTFFSAGAQTLTVQDTSPSAITGTSTVAVVPAAASHFLILAPATAVAGTPFDVVLAALDPYGNVDENYAGSVTWTSSDTDPGVLLPGDYTFQASDHGAVTFPAGVTLVTLGDQTLTVTDPVSGLTGSATVTVGVSP